MESAVRSTKHRGRSKKGNNASNSSISNSTSSSSSSSSVSNYNNADDGRALTDKSYNFSEVGEIHANVATKSMIAPMDTKEFSRDEIVSNLMIMGFPESECLRALTSCGCDIDAAISWLCESPNSGDSTDKSHSENAYLNESNGIDGNDNTFLDNTKKRVEAELQQMMAAAAKAKKDADHKEELRRINRAWNIRAEGEKKRLEMEKRHREVEKQRMTLAAQKISRPPSSEGSGGYIPSYTSQVYPNTIHFDRNIDSSTICGSNGQNRSSFSVMEQQYFPPLSSDKCSQMALIHSQGTTYLQEGGKEQTLISHQSSRLHLESALVDTNPELSIDGLNKGAKEFVPKFSVTSAVLDMQNDIIPSQLLCRHEQGIPPQPPVHHVVPLQTNTPYIPSSLHNVSNSIHPVDSQPDMRMVPLTETSEMAAPPNGPQIRRFT